MPATQYPRRDLLKVLGLGALSMHLPRGASTRQDEAQRALEDFLIRQDELALHFAHPEPERRLSFSSYQGAPEEWRERCRDKLRELLGLTSPPPCAVRELRRRRHEGVEIRALVLAVDEALSVPAYLLVPDGAEGAGDAVLAIHGHGEVGPCVGVRDDYHHRFALELARAGKVVLCPALRGFGPLADLAAGLEGRRLDYWAPGYHFTLVLEGFLHGRTLIGQTVADLLRWEDWLHRELGVNDVDVAGISYGGDLALTYPAFSDRVRHIFASGSLGSFSVIFSRCYNAPAHCVPGILRWMDRSDIAGLSAPRPIRLHYGELDTPAPDNWSASFNETVAPSMSELRAIYAAFGAADAVSMVVTPGRAHEMDNGALLEFLAG